MWDTDTPDDASKSASVSSQVEVSPTGRPRFGLVR